jgi:hypothetical protein
MAWHIQFAGAIIIEEINVGTLKSRNTRHSRETPASLSRMLKRAQ